MGIDQGQGKSEIFSSGMVLKAVDVNVTPYNVALTDFIIQNRYTITADATVNLPAISTVQNGQMFIIIDSGNAATAAGHNLIIVPNGADAINSTAAPYTINTSRDARTLLANKVTNNWEFTSWFRAV